MSPQTVQARCINCAQHFPFSKTDRMLTKLNLISHLTIALSIFCSKVLIPRNSFFKCSTWNNYSVDQEESFVFSHTLTLRQDISCIIIGKRWHASRWFKLHHSYDITSNNDAVNIRPISIIYLR